MNAGRELDALIAEKVMRWKLEPTSCRDDCNNAWLSPRDSGAFEMAGCECSLPRFSTDIGCAWEVVEKLKIIKNQRYDDEDGDVPEAAISALILMNDGKWMARFDSTCSLDEGYYERSCYLEDCKFAIGETAPHAICLAALKAVGYAY